MRGSRTLANDLIDPAGIIPAHAGLTMRFVKDIIRNRDHPRACGAHLYAAEVPPREPGSSPRMRGSHVLAPVSTCQEGIIPAHAGLTCRAGAAALRFGDHPRACGAHRQVDEHAMVVQGSSPRMRGSLDLGDGDLDNLGIIPAHAGLTSELA